jgi:formate dehydrogenase iron-sulfur subunit
MHCQDPACASACIVGALTKKENGAVHYDVTKCIGCRYCMVACPFEIPAYEYHDPITPRVMKCTFCYERVANRRANFPVVRKFVRWKPSPSVGAAPAQAGPPADTKESRPIHRPRIRRKEVGGTSWMYLSGQFPSTAGLQHPAGKTHAAAGGKHPTLVCSATCGPPSCCSACLAASCGLPRTKGDRADNGNKGGER